MCGIAGIIGKRASRPNVECMVETMHHRGPDDYGIHSDTGVGLGMTRLAILDLSHLGHQPMRSHCGRYWIVYNGECYNHSEIRSELEASGDRFLSNSDTEVVVQAYAKWGKDCLKRMNGMFAFAIWDTLESNLFAARDRLGIKPFYYTISSGSFVFASELKTILASGIINFEAHSLSVYQYFLFGHVVQPLTIVKDIYALLPGHYLLWNGTDVRIQAYWSLADISGRQVNGEDAQELILEQLERSVKKQLISDRPVGLFLSGGLDSATILACMTRLGAAATTFSLGFESNPYARSEETEVKELASYFGANHNQVNLTGKEVLSDIQHFFDSLDQPSVDGLNTFLVSKHAVKDMTVALSGLGGDELFGGYTRQALIWWKYCHNPSWLEWLLKLIIPSIVDSDTALRLRSRGSGNDILFNYTVSRSGGKRNEHSKLLSTNLLSEVRDSRLFLNTFKHLHLPRECGPVNQIFGLEMQAFMGSQLLRDMDVLSMAHSLEVRFPLIDHEMVELAFQMPSNLKMNLPKNRPTTEGAVSYGEGKTKKLLLETMLPFLPPGFEKRRKSGFKLPIGLWLRNELREFAIDLLQDAKTRQDLVSKFAIEEHIQDLLKGTGDDWESWKIIAFLGALEGIKNVKKR